MLEIVVHGEELWDADNERFIPADKDYTLTLEHSLISISKWESKWKKSFIMTKDKSNDEMTDYVRCMTLNNVPDDVYNRLSRENIADINRYINDTYTATKFYEDEKSKQGKDTITSELIYYWMIANNIPFECQKWHLNRLLTLIKVCGIKNSPPKKMSKHEIMERNRRLNDERRKLHNTKG